MVDGVADEVRERVADRLDERTIELGVGPVDLERHLLPAGHGEIADDPRKLAEHVLDRLHPRLHRRRLERRGDGVDAVHDLEELGVIVPPGGRRVADGRLELVAGKNELADELDERPQEAEVDTDRLLGYSRPLGPRRGRLRRERCG